MGQIVVFAFSPLITRIYGPEAFGLQGVFLSLISILSPLSAMRYPMAIVVARSDDDAQRLARLALLIAVGVSCAVSLQLLFAGDQILDLLGAEALGPLIWFLPLALFCVALQDVADYRAARLGAFRLVGVVTVIQAFIVNFARVLGGLIAPVTGILVAITSAAPAVQAGMLTFGNRKRFGSPTSLRPADLTLLKEHRDFPLFRVPTDVLNSASQSVPVILLAALYSPAVAGLYVLTRSVLNLPVNVIGAAIGNVLYARFAQLAQERTPLVPLLLRSTAAMLSLAPGIIGLAWFAPEVFSLVFGEEWRDAGYYARWMAMWIATAMVNTPLNRVMPVIAKQNILLYFNIALLLTRSGSILFAYSVSGSALDAIALYSITSVAAISIGCLVFLLYVRDFDRRRA
jgi:O-antigen/teichoic acid export membrane protein